jgi:hypothetical protein
VQENFEGEEAMKEKGLYRVHRERRGPREEKNEADYCGEGRS